jgi:ATP-dependent Clp protease, protease subunit
MATDFQKYAKGHLGLSGTTLDKYSKVVSSYINPTIIEERQLNIASMDVFSRLMMDRIIFLGVPIDSDVANIIQAQLLFLDSNDHESEIKLYINSPGGCVYSGLGIYDTMNLITSPIHTVCVGMAASMASFLLAAGEKGNRAALPHSRVLIHQPMGSAGGQASDIEIAAAQIVKLKAELYDILSEHTGQPIDKISADSDRDYWMTAQEALDYGIIDIIHSKSSKKNGQEKK